MPSSPPTSPTWPCYRDRVSICFACPARYRAQPRCAHATSRAGSLGAGSPHALALAAAPRERAPRCANATALPDRSPASERLQARSDACGAGGARRCSGAGASRRVAGSPWMEGTGRALQCLTRMPRRLLSPARALCRAIVADWSDARGRAFGCCGNTPAQRRSRRSSAAHTIMTANAPNHSGRRVSRPRTPTREHQDEQ